MCVGSKRLKINFFTCPAGYRRGRPFPSECRRRRFAPAMKFDLKNKHNQKRLGPSTQSFFLIYLRLSTERSNASLSDWRFSPDKMSQLGGLELAMRGVGNQRLSHSSTGARRSNFFLCFKKYAHMNYDNCSYVFP